MKGLSGKGKLEARIRELLFDRENSRAELNELLRQNKEAQAITARLLIEEAVLVSELRLENARDRLGTLEPREVFPATQSPPAEPGRKISKRRIGILAGLAAAACLIAALWLTHKPTEEAPPEVASSWTQNQSIGLRRQMQGERVATRAVPVAEGEDLELGPGRTHIDLDNGVIVSVNGPARITVGLHETRLRKGEIIVYVPDDLERYIVETDDGRLVDLGNVFKVSVDPNQGTGIAVMSSEGQAGRTPRQGTLQGGAESQLDTPRGGIRLLEAKELPARILIQLPNTTLKVPPAYREVVDEANPILAWDFEKVVDGNTLPNRAGPGLVGIIRGNPGFGGEEGANQHLILGQDGHEGWIDADGPWRKNDREPFTFELWARPDRIHWGHLFHLRVETPMDPVFRRPPKNVATYFCLEFTHTSKFPPMVNRPSVRVAFRSPATEHASRTLPGGVNAMLSSPRRYVPGHWHHLVARVGRNDFTLFVNGRIVTQEAIKRTDFGEQDLMIRLGQLLGTASSARRFAGAIDEVALYPRALSNEEVQRHYQVMTADSE